MCHPRPAGLSIPVASASRLGKRFPCPKGSDLAHPGDESAGAGLLLPLSPEDAAAQTKTLQALSEVRWLQGALHSVSALTTQGAGFNEMRCVRGPQWLFLFLLWGRLPLGGTPHCLQPALPAVKPECNTRLLCQPSVPRLGARAGSCTWGRWGGGPRGYLEDVGVGAALVGLAVLRVLEQHAVHVRAGVLEEAIGAVEDDEGDLTVAEHAQLIGLLHQPELPLSKRHLEPGPTGSVEKTWIGGGKEEMAGPNCSPSMPCCASCVPSFLALLLSRFSRLNPANSYWCFKTPPKCPLLGEVFLGLQDKAHIPSLGFLSSVPLSGPAL